MAIDWANVKVAADDITPKELTEASAMRFGGAPVKEAKFTPTVETTVLPAAGGLLGGVLASQPQLRTAGLGLGLLARGAGALSTRVPQMFAPYVPSLFGSTVGTAAGTAAERAYEGDLFTQEGAKQMAGNLAENAVWDVGGNLAFKVAGKVIRVAKDMLPFRKSEIPDAAVAAQKFLSERGATLTRSQLTGDTTAQFVESAVKEGSGAGAFKQQEEAVKNAVMQGRKELLDSMQTTDAFQAAINAGERPFVPAGAAIQSVIKDADTKLAEKVSPFYSSLDEKAQNIFVNIKDIKASAQKELNKMKNFPKGYTQKEYTALESILEQPDEIPFSTAHQIRSDFKTNARDIKAGNEPASNLERIYNKYSNSFDTPMDNAFEAVLNRDGYKPFLEKTGKDNAVVNLKREYEATKNLYREGIGDIYSDTMSSVLSKNPERVGEYLYQTGSETTIQDLHKLVTRAQELGAVDQTGKKITSGQMLNNIRYGYVTEMLSTPEKIAEFSSKLAKDTRFAATFERLFADPKQRNFITTMANAAEKGLGEMAGRGLTLEGRQIGKVVGAGEKLTQAGLAASGVGAYYALSPEAQERIKENFPETALAGAASLGAILITPKMIAKAFTNKQTMDALIGLAKAQEAPKYGGAVTAKIIDRLNDIGVFNSEYINEVNSVFNRPREQQTQQRGIDWNSVQVQ